MVMKEFANVKTRGYVTKLLREIQAISLQIEANTLVYDALDKANAMWYTYKQEIGESNAKHLRNIKSKVLAVENLGGTTFSNETLIKIEE